MFRRRPLRSPHRTARSARATPSLPEQHRAWCRYHPHPPLGLGVSPGHRACAPRLGVSPGVSPGVLPWCSTVSPSLDQAPLSFCPALLGEGAPPSHRRGRKITYCPVCSNCTIGTQIYKRVLALPSANTFPSHLTTALQHRYTSRICVLYCIFFLVFPAQLSVFCLARSPRQKGLEFRTAHTGDRKKGRREGEKKQRLFITSTN